MTAAEQGSQERETAPFAFGPRVALSYSTLFFFVGLYLPFFPLWLKERGLTPTEISIVLTLPLLLRVLTTAQVSALADRSERANIVIVLYFLSAVAALAYIVAQGCWTILVVTGLFSLFNNPIVPVLDSLALSGVRRYGADYGRIRLWGSIVFLAANLGGGALLEGYDVETLLHVLIASIFAGALFAPLLPRIGPPRRANRAAALSGASTWSLLADRRFLLIVLASGIINASHALIYGFGSIYWQSLGFSGPQIGALWATGVIAEVVLFHFSRPVLARFGAVNLLIIGGFAAVARWMLMLAEPPLAGFFALQAVHGLTFGAAHLGTMHFLADTVEEDRMGTAQGLTVMVGGLAMAVATFSSGPLYGAFGVHAYVAMALSCVLALALIFAAPQPQKPGSGGETSAPE